MLSGDGPELATAVVLAADEESCTVYRAGARRVVPFAAPFPRPRAERVSPGHAVALITASDEQRVVWRWFDAVVLAASPEGVLLWEPLHGRIMARVRNPDVALRPGSRAYVSAGLPGAEWWVAGPVGGAAEETALEVAEVRRFYVDHGLWGQL